MKRRIEVGLLFSRSGNYPLVSEACRIGALHAIADVNADPAGAIELVPVERDPQGNADRYASLAEDILKNSSARHIIGTVTSWSRKEAIPVLEKAGGTVWYPCPYEGFEANEHVVYMHACPNQHLVPLLAYVIPCFGADGFLTGSNYIWGWETNRVARDLIADAGGSVRGERYLALGETDVARLIAEIEATRPDFILNNLIGPSSYAFIAAYAELARRNPHFGPERCPILSCNLTECELPAIGAAGEGHLSVGPYFRDALSQDRASVDQLGAGNTPTPIPSPQGGGGSGRAFIAQDYRGLASAGTAAKSPSPLWGGDRGGGNNAPYLPGSSLEAAAYSSVSILANILADNPDAVGTDLPAAFTGKTFATPLGEIAIDPNTQHATLPVRIGQIEQGAFRTISHIRSVVPDPYLSRYDRAETFGRPRLKVVS